MEEVKFKVRDRVRIVWRNDITSPYEGVINRRYDSGTLDVDDKFGGFRETDGKYDSTEVIAWLEMVEPAKSNGGLRYNADKLRLDLIPTEWIVELARVMTVGSYKYADRNWELGMDWSKCIACLERHLTRWKSGQTMVDKETGCHELAMVAWNALALLTYELCGLGKDDRVKTPYDANFKWTEGPGTQLGLSAEQIADLKAKFKKDAK